MAELEFDSKNLQSIKLCQKKLNTIGVSHLNSTAFKCLEQAYHDLKNTKSKHFEEIEYSELLKLFSMLTQRCLSKKWLDEIKKFDVCKIYSQIIEYYKTAQELNYINLESIFASLAILGNNSERLALEFLKEGLFSKALAIFDRDDFIEHKIKNGHISDAYDQILYFLILNSKYQEIHAALDAFNASDILLHHLKNFGSIRNDSKLSMTKLNIASCLTFYIGERDIEELRINETIIDFWIGFHKREDFKSALYSKNEEKLFENIFLNIQLTLYIDATIRIAMVDSIKQQLFENDIVSIINDLIKSEDDEFVERSFELLASLSFNTSFVDYLKHDKELVKLYKRIADSSKNELIKRSWLTIDDTLNQKFLVRLLQRPNKGTVKNGHIMISYHSRYKSQCKIINERLKVEGYKIWMSIQTTSNDYLEAMATAIENAALVLLCFSKDYKLNNNCRLEAEYTQALAKPIVAIRLDPVYIADGWLGSILKEKGYIDYSNEDEKFEEIANRIEKELDLAKSEVTARSLPDHLGNTEDWDFTVVNEWFQLNKMNDLGKAFYGYSGEDMKKLYKIKQNDMDRYYKTIEKETAKFKVNVSKKELFEFDLKLDKLFR